MITLSILVAAVLCALLALASYVHLLYAESLRLRPKVDEQRLNFFQAELRPLLQLDADAGVQRFATAKQCLILLLALDLAFLFSHRDGFTLQGLLECLLLAGVLLVLFAYVAPHVLVTRTSGRWALRAVLPARLVSAAVQPLLVVAGFGYSIVDLGVEAAPEEPPPTPSENIETLMDAGQEEGLLEEDDRRLIQSVVEFGDKTVREVMTPRPQIVAIEASASLGELRQVLIDEAYSRLPVYEGTIDSIKGFVHVRDILEIEEHERETRRVGELRRPVLFVPETKRVSALLREMQERSLHMAIVVDEYGNTAGLATLEDLVEEIVGEIRDESEPEPDVKEEPDHSFVVSGNLDLDRLKDLTGFRPDRDVESTTLSGLVTEWLGHVPSAGEILQLDGLQIEVLSSTALRVERLRVRRRESPAEAAETA